MLRKLAACGVLICAFAGHAYADDPDKTVLTQGGTSVTLGDVDAFMQRIPEERRGGFFANPKRVNQMLITILRNKQLAKQAVELKLDQTSEVKAEIQFITEDALARARTRAFEQTLKVPTMTAAAKEEYAAHKSEYMLPANVEVQHILISGSEHSEEEAKALAEKVRNEALANPAGFGDLVKKYSEDQSKTRNNGLIPQASSDKMAPEFAHAAAKLKTPGEISPIVKTSFGLHVLKLIRAAPTKTVPFEDVKDKIETKLKDNYLAEQRRIWMQKFDSGTPQVNPQGMDLMQQRYAPAGMPSIEEAVKSQSTN